MDLRGFHVFIKNGLSYLKQSIAILEIGFGTGLNAFITYLESLKMNQIIKYVESKLIQYQLKN
jgi:tRNA U34 5-methylaminomethyl-2-thiouridine-forming methyltransferase MnmC